MKIVKSTKVSYMHGLKEIINCCNLKMMWCHVRRKENYYFLE